MDQRLAFCKTTEGVRIAYATVGSGPALVVAPSALCHLEVAWEEPRVRDFWETIARHHLVVRYDRHGCGLSDRDRIDFSLDSEVRTIEAIVKELELKSFALWGDTAVGAAAAIAYAVKYAEGISHLILCNAHARWHGAPALGDLSHESIRMLALTNFRMASLALAEAWLGNSFDAAALQWYLRLRQEALTPETGARLLAAAWKLDIRDLLPKVSVPTLVIHYRNDRYVPFDAGRDLAAGIRGARFVPLEGDTHIYYFRDTRPLRRAIAEFLGDPIEEAEPPAPDSTKVPSPPEPSSGVFRKEGEYWSISCWGEVFRLRDVKGLAYVAYLLGHSREELHVLSLASNVGGQQGELDESAEPTVEGQATQSDLTVGRMGDAGEVLDALAKAAYKQRTAELREQLAEARERNQHERVDQIEGEIEALGHELSRAVGLGGRDRRAVSASEWARINVTRAIKVALERIAGHNPALAALLTKSIRTGNFCSYTPDSRLPASWQL